MVPGGRLSSNVPDEFALPAGDVAAEHTGHDVDVVTGGLNQPTSLEFIGNTAYVITLSGEIWKIDDVSGPSFGRAR